VVLPDATRFPAASFSVPRNRLCDLLFGKSNTQGAQPGWGMYYVGLRGVVDR
jgi:hypothetical protein